MLTDVVQVCTDGSELSIKAVDTAIELAKAFDAPLLGMTAVSARHPRVAGGDLEGVESAARQRLLEIRKKAESAGVRCEILAEPGASPSEGILTAGKRYNARFIVMASRGLSTLGSFILGSETQKVLASADRPVLVIR